MNHIASPLQTPASLPQLSQDDIKSLGKDIGNQRIDDAASEFESVFISLLLKEMRNTLDPKEGGLFGSEGSDTFGGMFDMFMGQHLAEAQPLGIADAVKGYLSNMPTDPESP